MFARNAIAKDKSQQLITMAALPAFHTNILSVKHTAIDELTNS